VKLRAFGKTDLMVSEFGIGCARIGGIFQNDARGFVDLLSAARDRGINFFDTADMYSQGESEQLLGRAFRRARSRVVIASKVGYCLPARRMVAARLKPLLRPVIRFLGIRRDRLPSGARGALAQDFSVPYLRKAVEGSLRRLRTDYLDVLQLHSPPLDVVERGEWLPALEALKKAGKIRYYGIACDTVDVGLAALRYPGVSSVQITLNLLEHRADAELLPQSFAKGVAVIARECLANGLLAKRVEDIDLAAVCSSPEEQKLREEQLATCRREAAESGRSLTRMALDYASKMEGVSVALLGVRSIQQLNGLLSHTGPVAAKAAVA
jgi:aryl-alcohol dehydrogenase-like predicted oxidoreductase